MNCVYMYVFDTMADWELSHTIAMLNSGQFFRKKNEKFIVKAFALTKEAVKTMGGITILPDFTIDMVKPTKNSILLLPGGNTWNDERHTPVIRKAGEFLSKKLLTGAICGATTALANAGFLDKRPHTSNSLEFLKMTAPNYKGEKFYWDEKAVIDDNLITASAAGSLLFAVYILKYLKALTDPALEAWYKYYNTGKSEYLYKLLSLQQ